MFHRLVRRSLFAALIALALSSSPAAVAGSSVSLLGAAVYPQTSTVGTTEISGKLGYGAGLLGELRMTHHLGLEAGGIYLMRKFETTVGGASPGQSLRRSVYVPVGLRIHPNPTVTLQGGGFYDVSVESGEASNFGVQGGVRLAFRAGNGSSFFVEGRYNLGLKDHDGVKRSDLVLGLVGLTFGPGGGR